MQPEQWVVLLPSFACVHALQENVKARHPQLLYESKLYKILQGGGGSCGWWCTTVLGVTLLLLHSHSHT